MGCGESKPAAREDTPQGHVVPLQSNGEAPSSTNSSSRKVVPVDSGASNEGSNSRLTAVSTSNVSTTAPQDDTAGHNGVSKVII